MSKGEMMSVLMGAVAMGKKGEESKVNEENHLQALGTQL